MNNEQRRRSAPRANRHNHRKRLVTIDNLGKRSNCRCIKEQADRKAEVEGAIDPGKQVDRQQRISAVIEKTVGHPELIVIEDIAEDGEQLFFQFRPRRYCLWLEDSEGTQRTRTRLGAKPYGRSYRGW